MENFNLISKYALGLLGGGSFSAIMVVLIRGYFNRPESQAKARRESIAGESLIIENQNAYIEKLEKRLDIQEKKMFALQKSVEDYQNAIFERDTEIRELRKENSSLKFRVTEVEKQLADIK